jgi:SAM-dependent methyltransferase
MELRAWDERYRSGERVGDLDAAPTPLLAETARLLAPGRALDLACGAGRNALWLAEHGWSVTAVDGSRVAIKILRQRASKRSFALDAKVADLEKGEYEVEPSRWNLIAICHYLQRDLFEPAKRGVVPGGVLIAIAHLTGLGEEPTPHRLRPSELEQYFKGWEILHYHEGTPSDSAHHRSIAEIVEDKQNNQSVCKVPFPILDCFARTPGDRLWCPGN